MAADMTPRTNAALCLDFRPDAGLVTKVSRFVSDFYGHALADPVAVSRLALAAHELLENVVKYSCDGRSRFEIELADTPSGGILTIRVQNRTTPERADELCALLGELERTADPLDLYVRTMRANAPRQDRSGLGLIRIRAEADMDVRCEFRGDEVTIVAQGNVAPVRRSIPTVKP